jgi:type III pantothenate kinase
MLLAIDVGNTNTVFALHDGNDWVHSWRSATDSTKTADDHASWLWRLADLHGVDLSGTKGCVISTVVPQAQFNFRTLARRYLNVEPMFIGEPGLKTGVELRVRHPEQVGADRIASALGAHVKYPGNLIVIDSGTATTLDVVAADGAFEGGIISPGIYLSMRALHEAAAAGDYATACDWQDRLIGLHKALFLDNSPAPTKYALSRLGFCTEEMRLPLSLTSDAVKPAIDRAMADAGLG